LGIDTTCDCILLALNLSGIGPPPARTVEYLQLQVAAAVARTKTQTIADPARARSTRSRVTSWPRNRNLHSLDAGREFSVFTP